MQAPRSAGVSPSVELGVRVQLVRPIVDVLRLGSAVLGLASLLLGLLGEVAMPRWARAAERRGARP